MIWRATVRVSQQSYTFSRPIIYLLRLSGLFPFKIERKTLGKLYMQWSPLYATYSYLIELFLHVTMSWGWAIDISRKGIRSVRIHSTTDLVLSVVDTVCLQIAMVFMVTVISLKYLHFFAYVKCINQVDKVLDTNHLKWDALKQCFLCYLWWFIVLGIHFFSFVKRVVKLRERFTILWILQLYLSHHLLTIVVMFGEYQYMYLGDSLSDRKVAENRLFLHYAGRVIQKMADEMEFNVQYPGERIGVLMRTYLKLVEAAQHQNRLLGETAVVITGVAFWHLVYAMYNLCFEMTNVYPHAITIGVNTVTIFFHAARLLMITESWHACCVEVETTKKWICQLHCTAVGRKIRKKLLTFQMILCLRKIEFTLAGFYNIDRAMVTSLIGATTTYVLVLLSYRSQDTE